jgi:DNA-binding transcriptional regulator YiaG
MEPDEVRAAREAFGLTQKQMDARLGVGKDSTRDWERGKRAVPGPASLALKLLLALRDAKRTAASTLYEAFWG